QLPECPVDRRRSGLQRVALAPRIGMEGVADLVARPALRPPGAGLPQPAAAFAIDHGEHAEALHHPRARLPQEPAPSLRPRHRATDVARGLFIALQLGEAVEVAQLRRPQHEALGFYADPVAGHLPFLPDARGGVPRAAAISLRTRGCRSARGPPPAGARFPFPRT